MNYHQIIQVQQQNIVNGFAARMLLDNRSTFTLIRPRFVNASDIVLSDDRIMVYGKGITDTAPNGVRTYPCIDLCC